MADAERILWQNMRKGNNEAFSFIYKTYSGQLYLYGLKFTSRQDLIEDCIHDLFINLLNRTSKINDSDNIQYYLLKSFRNNLIRLLKREKVYREVNEGCLGFEVVFSIEESIINTEEENRQNKLLAYSLMKLSARQKEAIYLRYTKGFAYKQVAGILDMEIESCRNLISRALAKLKKTIQNDMGLLLFLLSSVEN